jgi:ferritin
VAGAGAIAESRKARFFFGASRLIPHSLLFSALTFVMQGIRIFFQRRFFFLRSRSMIKDSVVKALSDQVNAEFYSAYLYLAMSAYADRSGYKGIANWFFIQAQEETAHAVHIYQHILERGASVSFPEIKAPESSYTSIKDAFEKTLAHERLVTGLINKIATLAQEEKDHASYNFIMWYVNEQIEEEATAEEILAKINLTAGHPGLLFSLDAEMGSRTYSDPFSGA